MNPDTHTQRVLIIVSGGPSTPARCAAPFHTATLLAYMDAKVTLFLGNEDVQLTHHAIADQLRTLSGGGPLHHFIRQARKAGARLLMCRQPGMNIDESELVEELNEISNGGELARLILGSKRVLTLRARTCTAWNSPAGCSTPRATICGCARKSTAT